jgi:restriction system protein
MGFHAESWRRLIWAVVWGVVCIIAFVTCVLNGDVVGSVFALVFLAGVTFVLWFTLLRRNQLRTAGLDQVDTMSGVEFERYVAAVLQGLGYTAIEYTKTTGDFGVDRIATPRRASGGRIRRSARRPPPRLNEFKQPADG